MSTKREVSQIVTIFGIILLVCAALPAQTVNSSVVGRVVDQANAVIAAAPVTLTDQNTGAVRNAVSDSSGVFRFPDVFPSTYTVSVKMSGFKTETMSNVVVAASETRELSTMIM